VVGTGSNMVLVVGLSLEDTAATILPVKTITYNGAAMTAVPNSIATVGTSTLNRAALYYLLNPASGSHSVSVSFNGAVNGIAAGSISLSGVSGAPITAATGTVTSGNAIS